jgi:hypothetical protein
MKKSMFCVLSAAALMGAVLTSTAASAAVTSNTPNEGDPATTVTMAVSSGAIMMTAPSAVFLGAGAPATTITSAVGTTVVTDNRALLSASWTATASSTDWTTGAGTPAETIAAGAFGYVPGAVTTTGTITATGTTITLSGTAQPVVAGTAGVGNNTATWDPTLSVAVPSAAVVGTYTGTLTQSVG